MSDTNDTGGDKAGENTQGGSSLIKVLIDAGLPLAAYYGLRLAGQDEQIALLAGAVLAALRLTWVAVRRRSFDVVSGLMAAVLAVGLVLSLVSGDARFVLLKESFGTAVAALVLLASCASRTPVVLVAVRAGSNKAKREEIDRLCEQVPAFRAAFTRMSAVWGIALLAEAILRVPLVYLVTPDIMAALSLVLLLAVIGALSAWTMWYAGRVQARHEPAAMAEKVGDPTL